MLQSIEALHNFGIFKNFSGDELNAFGAKNLIYGWNGSGKTTLGKLFRSIENRARPEENWLEGATFKIVIDDDTKIDETSIDANTLNVHTFNQDFVTKHIDWDHKIDGILLFGQKADDAGKLKKLEAAFAKKQIRFDENITNGQALGKELADFRTAAAKRIKAIFQTLETSESYYLQYNAGTLKKLLQASTDDLVEGKSILDEAQINLMTKAVKPVTKELISFPSKPLDANTLHDAAERINTLLNRSITAESIAHLTENPDIQNWVETGIQLHRDHNSSSCEFCGNDIPPERQEALNAHFSEAFADLKSRLERATAWLNDLKPQIDELPSKLQFYEDIAENYDASTSALNASLVTINEYFDQWLKIIADKFDNPFKANLSIDQIPEVDLQAANSAISTFLSLVTRHNEKTENFAAELSRTKKALEHHYVSAEIQAFSYLTKQTQHNTIQKENELLNTEVQTIAAETATLRRSMTDESLGATQFNDALHRFMGRADITLQFNTDKLGYEIIRKGGDKHTGHLSEGEKTAIAFVYFFTKLQEKGNTISDSIVVIDDPVSSFDNNHIFHAFSFLKARCSNAKQLFIFTHNLTFFKLVRDWYQRMDNNRRGKNKGTSCEYYLVETTRDPDREAKLCAAPKALLDYQSEYHYLFQKLYSHHDKNTLEIDDALLVATLCRKLLEAFLSFKFPDCRGNIRILIDKGQSQSKTVTPEIADKVYWFIQKYSHSDIIEIDDDKADTMFNEGNNVVPEVFAWIKDLDEGHYNAMCNTLGLE